MTLLQLSSDYRQSASILAERITLLNQRKAHSRNWDERCLLEARIQALATMQREARELAVLLEHYYERGYRRNVKYTL